MQVAAYFPTIGLTASGSTSGIGFGHLFSAASNFWSFGIAAAQTLLDFRARKARVAEARAAYRQVVAQYRQTLLTAFGEVEKNLAAADVLAREEVMRHEASVAADRAEAVALNQHKAGLIAHRRRAADPGAERTADARRGPARLPGGGGGAGPVDRRRLGRALDPALRPIAK